MNEVNETASFESVPNELTKADFMERLLNETQSGSALKTVTLSADNMSESLGLIQKTLQSGGCIAVVNNLGKFSSVKNYKGR